MQRIPEHRVHLIGHFCRDHGNPLCGIFVEEIPLGIGDAGDGEELLRARPSPGEGRIGKRELIQRHLA